MCHCNSKCSQYDNCCSDYEALCNGLSCQGRCGETYNSQNKCHCNIKCGDYNNCCSDYTSLCGSSGGGDGGSDITDAEIKSMSEALYALDSNKPSASELIIDSQARVPDSQTSSQNDLSPRPLFQFLDEASLFSKPSYAAFMALLDNYERNTGITEDFTPQQLAEQDTFLREAMSNTELGRELYAFLFTKGRYSSEEEFLHDLKMMCHSFDGPWTSYPDVLGMQFMWGGYFKQVGSSIIGCSPEFDLAVYSLCYITRPGKQCKLSLGGKPLVIQTYTWDKSSYGNGKKYIGSAFPATP
ncbi:unnamed protein product, partial [Coregonus sp. 'balchen']